MSEKDFNIESRLCAYIDGLLDAEQREQIEQYLDRYPENRQLIDELMQERALLRDLPHEPAPPDVLAHFRGRLERSVLLDDLAGDTSTGRSARRRWNVAAFAATLLLLAGIGVIVWIAMPPKRGARSSNIISEVPPSPVEPIAASQPAATAAASEPATERVAQPWPEMLATVVSADDHAMLMIFSDDLPAAEERADQFLRSHHLTRTPPSSTRSATTQPATTQPATTTVATAQSNIGSPAPEATWSVLGMTPAEAEQMSAWISSAGPAAPATNPSMQLVASSLPTTQAQPASQPARPMIIYFEKFDFPAKNTINPAR